jgi:hypothetical protein
MWKSLLQKHCSDELLLASLDGELSLRRERTVKKHLAACWECRARLSELEHQAEAVARSVSEQRFPGPDHIERAKNRFLLARDESERSIFLRPQIERGFSLATRLGFATVVASLFVGSVIYWRASRSQVPDPREILGRTQAFEQAQTGNAAVVHQSFRVEIAPLDRAAASIRHLDVWSEASSGRFAARGTDESGTLRDAVWCPNTERQYLYSSGSALRLVTSSTTERTTLTVDSISEDGFDPDKLQRGFVRWVEGQRWQTLSLSSGLAVFISENGIMLRAERTRDASGRSLIRLRAGRDNQGRKVEISLDIDPESYRPIKETIRFQASDEAVEVRLFPERTEGLVADQVRPALFEPDGDLLASNIGKKTLPTPVATKPLDSGELAALEVDVLHRLDQIGAVMGEETSVSRTDGKILVQGVVDSEQRKDEILQSLADFEGNPAIDLKILTATEAGAAEAEARKTQPTAGHVILRELEMTKEPTPVFAELRQLLAESQQTKQANAPSKTQTSSPDRQDDQIRQFARTTLDESQQALLHAWALKHLIERFAPDELKAMTPDAQAKWRGLIDEHAEGFRKETEALRQSLEPVFYSNAPTSLPSAEPRDGVTSNHDSKVISSGQLGDGPVAFEAADLYGAIDELFAMASAHDEALRSAFVISAETQSLDKIKSPAFLQSLKNSEALAKKIEGKSPRED